MANALNLNWLSINEKIIGECNFIEIEIKDRTLRLKGKPLSVLYRCKTGGMYVLDEENERYKFESYAESLDLFEQKGWDFFMRYPEYVTESTKAVWILRRR